MKNLFKCALLALVGLLFITSCGTEPPAKPEQPAPVVETDVPEPTPEPTPVPEETPVPEPVSTVNYTEYTVVKGDTLSQIAEKFYGSKDKAYFFPIIIAYTLDSYAKVNVGEEHVAVSLNDPDVIEPGTTLRVPNFDEFMASSLHTMAVKPLFEKIAVQYEKKGRSGVAKLLRERAERLGK